MSKPLHAEEQLKIFEGAVRLAYSRSLCFMNAEAFTTHPEDTLRFLNGLHCFHPAVPNMILHVQPGGPFD